MEAIGVAVAEFGRKLQSTSTTRSVDGTAAMEARVEMAERKERLPELYVRRLAEHGHPLESWGVDAAAIREAFEKMDAVMAAGLIVGGKFGRGKSTLVEDILPGGVLRIYVSSPTSMKMLDCMLNDDRPECEEQHLFVDDIGGDTVRNDYGTARDYVAEYLWWWMDLKKRMGWKKRLFLTTNKTLNELNERYGTRLVSRIMENCVPLKLAGPNRRAVLGGTEAWKGF